MTTAAQLRLIRNYHARLTSIREGTSIRVGAAWDTLGGIGDSELAAFSARAAVLVKAGQVATVRLTDGYLGAYIGSVLKRPARAQGILPEVVTGAAVRGGVAPVEVYARPIITARTALSQGRTLTAALAAGRARATGTAETDVMLTHRATASEFLQREPRVRGYQRVLSGRSCDLCAIASTQVYRSDELMPIHDHCDCGVDPLIGDERGAGRIINRDRYEEMKSSGAIDRISNQRAVARAKESGDLGSLIATETHGELGPLITVAGQRFTGPGDV